MKKALVLFAVVALAGLSFGAGAPESFWVSTNVITSVTATSVTNPVAAAASTSLSGYARSSIRIVNNTGTACTLYSGSVVSNAVVVGVVAANDQRVIAGAPSTAPLAVYAQSSATGTVGLVVIEEWGKGPAIIP